MIREFFLNKKCLRLTLSNNPWGTKSPQLKPLVQRVHCWVGRLVGGSGAGEGMQAEGLGREMSCL